MYLHPGLMEPVQLISKDIDAEAQVLVVCLTLLSADSLVHGEGGLLKLPQLLLNLLQGHLGGGGRRVGGGFKIFK